VVDRDVDVDPLEVPLREKLCEEVDPIGEAGRDDWECVEFELEDRPAVAPLAPERDHAVAVARVVEREQDRGRRQRRLLPEVSQTAEQLGA